MKYVCTLYGQYEEILNQAVHIITALFYSVKILFTFSRVIRGTVQKPRTGKVCVSK
jgi:hypothetical protein